MKSGTSLPLQIVSILSKHVAQIRSTSATATLFASSRNCEQELRYRCQMREVEKGSLFEAKSLLS